ncbi:MAG: hypothetical protein RL274_2124 [Pseudomonadota bacterium]
MSAIGMPAPRGKGFAISAYADYRHDHLFFTRQQSLQMREMDWEKGAKPLTPYSTLIMRGTGVAIFVIAFLGILI